MELDATRSWYHRQGEDHGNVYIWEGRCGRQGLHIDWRDSILSAAWKGFTYSAVMPEPAANTLCHCSKALEDPGVCATAKKEKCAREAVVDFGESYDPSGRRCVRRTSIVF